MDDRTQLVAVIVALWTLLTGFAGAVIKYLVDEVRRANEKVKAATDALAANTDAVELLTKEMGEQRRSTEEATMAVTKLTTGCATLETAVKDQAAIMARLARMRSARQDKP